MSSEIKLNWVLVCDIFRTFPPYNKEDFSDQRCLKHESLAQYSDREILSTLRMLIRLKMLDGEIIIDNTLPVFYGITDRSLKFCISINDDEHYYRVKQKLLTNPDIDLFSFLNLAVR